MSTGSNGLEYDQRETIAMTRDSAFFVFIILFEQIDVDGHD